MLWGMTRPMTTWADGNKVGKGQLMKNNNQSLMGAVQSWKMMEQVADNKRGCRAMEWTRDNRQQQINNHPLMGVAKVCKDTAMKAKAALAVNGAFHCPVDHGGGRKVGANGRAAVDNQQWQRQSGNNQIKVTVVSGGVDLCGGGGKQWRSMAIGSKAPTAKATAIAPSTLLLLPTACGGGRAAVAAARE
jgi:hypothetical protein